ncbi:Uncharacterised protein [Porphyromonas macacae]|uniref:Uncharacterized protein n=1 Tax=Porphyromonas macacae TaxID=28115 RepID=A0A379DET6_9PORP|nr:hypothetical protein [Porphyromonas macacae]SUB76918.1 Uncharacterised protein [Porphyromonas macacae]
MARRYLNASRKFLHIVAALFWLVPGIKIFYVGISRWAPLPSSFIIPVAWALVALIAFTFFIFPPVVEENLRYTRTKPGDRLPVYYCFKPSTWLIIIVMINFGIWLRSRPYIPDSFIAGFYSGLGIALILTSLRYIKPIKQIINDRYQHI